MRNRKLTAALQEVSKVMGEAVLLAPSNVGDSRAIRFRRNAVFYGCHCTVFIEPSIDGFLVCVNIRIVC